METHQSYSNEIEGFNVHTECDYESDIKRYCHHITVRENGEEIIDGQFEEEYGFSEDILKVWAEKTVDYIKKKRNDEEVQRPFPPGKPFWTENI